MLLTLQFLPLRVVVRSRWPEFVATLCMPGTELALTGVIPFNPCYRIMKVVPYTHFIDEETED